MTVISGIETTLRTLLRSGNPAATDLLVVALDSSQPQLRVGAVRALAMRSDPFGHRQLVERFPKLKPDARAALVDVPQRTPLGESLVEMIRPETPRLARRAAETAVAWGCTDALPAVADAILWPGGGFAPAFAADALRLAQRLEEAVRGYDPNVRDDSPHKPEDPAFARRAAVNALARALGKYGEHGRHEVIDALLLLTPSDEPVLLNTLRDSRHAAHEALLQALQTSDSRGAIGVLATALGDARSPKQLVELAAGRCDREGLAQLFQQVGSPIGLRLRENCARIKEFAWLAPEKIDVLFELPGAAQAAAVQLAAASDASRVQLASTIGLLLRRGEQAGRIAAARAIEDLPPHRAQEPLAWCLGEEDPAVLAVAVGLLRKKEYPDATGVLVGLLDHPDRAVRSAVQKGLRGLSFASFRDSAGSLPSADVHRVGRLVGKADPMAPATLRSELGSGAVARRLAALEMIDATGLAETLSIDLADRLQNDTDAGVRSEAARLLGDAESLPLVVETLRGALEDRSSSVRSAAKESLSRLEGTGPTTRIEAPAEAT